MRIIFIFLFFLASCNTKTIILPYILNKELSFSYNNYESSFNKWSRSIFYSEGRIADSCVTYFDLNTQHKVDENVYNYLVKSEYIMFRQF